MLSLWTEVGCYALRVTIPKEAEIFRDQIISDALSYSYAAIEFGASNETQFKTWSLVKNLSNAGHTNKSQYEYGVQNNRRPASQSPKPRHKNWPEHSRKHHHHPTKKTSHHFTPSPVAVSPFPFPLRTSINPNLVSDIYPQLGFHPLLFASSTPSLTSGKKTNGNILGHFEFRGSGGSSSSSSSPSPPQSGVLLTSGISVSGGGGGVVVGAKKETFKGHTKKGKGRHRFRKAKLHPIGLDHFNTGVQQAAALYDYSGGDSFNTTINPFPKLSPGYSRVTQNLPNVLPAIVYGSNHLDGLSQTDNTGSRNNSWIPIVGPGKAAAGSPRGNGVNKAKKIVNLTRILKSKSRPRYSSNYSGQNLKIRSHRLAGILSQNQKALSGGAAGDVIAVYPENKNYSTVTARSRAAAAAVQATTSKEGVQDEGATTTTFGEYASTTTESDIIHARITKIPNVRPLDVVLNVTTKFPVELDEKGRARLKAIRKIVRRLPYKTKTTTVVMR